MILMEIVWESICLATARSCVVRDDPWHWCSRYKQRGATNIQRSGHEHKKDSMQPLL